MQTDRAKRRIALGAGGCAVLTVMAFSVQQAWAAEMEAPVPILSIADAAAFQSAEVPRLRSGLSVELAKSRLVQKKPSAASDRSKSVAAVYFEEHFAGCEADDPFPAPGPYPTPPQFVVYNEDGRTPAVAVAYVTDAWIVREDFITATGNCAMFSTSWYTPAGSSNDWATFPAAGPITPTAGTNLTWRAMAPDASYPDGYEVRYSTTGNSPADFLGNAPLLTVGAENTTWTERSVDLSAHAGTPIYLAFRNNSNDKFLLLVDDVVVSDSDPFDPALDAISTVPVLEYSLQPLHFLTPVSVAAEVSNQGVNDLTDVAVDGDILLDGGSVNMFSTTPIVMAAGASQSVPIDSVTLDQLGAWTVEGTVSALEGDDDPGNSSLSSSLTTVSNDELLRAEGAITIGLGITGTGTGEIGHYFEIPVASVLTSARFILNNTGDQNGDEAVVNLRAWDSGAGTPGAIIETASATIPVDAPLAPIMLEADFPDTVLPVGRFVLTVVDPATGNIGLAGSEDRYTPGAGWAIVDGPTPSWSMIESLGFPYAFWLSAILTPVDSNPVADDDAFQVDEDSSLTDSVAGNDTPSSDGGNVWSELTPPSNGILSMAANGDFTYTPNTDFNGSDSFTYQLCDVDTDCDQATVTITVNPVNDLPTAEDDGFYVTQDGSLSADVSVNDLPSADGGNNWATTSSPTNGSLDSFGAGGAFTYTPNAGYNGPDSFTYEICDAENDCESATVSIEVLPLPIFADGMEDPG